MQKVILLDRDGVINYDSSLYIKSISEFHYIPGSLEAICSLHKKGFKVGIATNQSGISRGLYTVETLNSIHQKMLNDVERMGGKIHAIEYCPHLPEEYCQCRKPQPGMLLKLKDFFKIEQDNAYFVGDRLTDVEAAVAAGITPVFLKGNSSFENQDLEFSNVLTYSSLSDFVKTLY